MKIPDKYFGSGDIPRAVAAVGRAKKIVSALKRSMSFQNLPTASPPPVILPDGTSIRCQINRGECRAFIHAPIIGGVKQDEYERECFCNCSFALGYILQASEGTPTWPDENRRYDVIVCNRKDTYALFEYCLPSDHLDWESEAVNYGLDSVEGMPVIVFLENNRSDAHLCCPYETAGEVADITQTACSPTMPEEPDPDPHLAVPFYRITPIFPATLRKWWQVDSITSKSGKTHNGLLQDT